MKYGIEDVKRFLKKSSYGYSQYAWFSPTDVVPHSIAFKYACKKLYEQGLLERNGMPGDRCGYFYRIKKEDK